MNQLWRPPDDGIRPQKVTISKVPANGFDTDICPLCANVGVCRHACILLKHVDGNVAQKEQRLHKDMLKYAKPDYKEVLSDLATLYDEASIHDAIMDMPPSRAKAIAALLYFRFSKRTAGKFLHISRGYLYQVIKRERKR